MPSGSSLLLAQALGMSWQRRQSSHLQMLHGGSTTESHQIQVHQGERICSYEGQQQE
jgi:hypothetical protein